MKSRIHVVDVLARRVDRAGFVFLGFTLLILALAWWFLPHAGDGSLPGLFLISVPFHLPERRRHWLGDHLLALFRKTVPPMSDTEREALDAGTVSWDGELFSGRPDWNALLALPSPRLRADEERFLNGPVETLCRMLDDWHITHETQDLPPAVWRFIKEQGFFGMIIPHRYGGLEFSALAHSSVVMKIASRSITAAVTVMVPNSLGPAQLLLQYGTDAQKAYFLPRLARGEEVPCFALTGPEAGSDAASIPDYGVVCEGQHEGRTVLGIRLNWEKRYITLGPVATLLGLAFKLYDPDHRLGQKDELGITLALIPTHTPGVEIGRRHLPLNIPFQNGPNRGRDVFIPLEWIIGGPARAGQGWRMLMECLADGRAISLPALSTGAAKLACRFTGAYARVRRQFGRPIGHFEGVEEPLARIAAAGYTLDAARGLTTGLIDRGEKPAVISAIAKYNSTETMRRVVNDAMDIHGGSGICLGPNNLLGRVYQALPIAITVEGANILTRSLIIFGQGVVRSHPYVREEMAALTDPEPGRASTRLERALAGHVWRIAGNASRSAWHGLTRGHFAAAPRNAAVETRHYYRQLSRLSAAFAVTTDAALLSLGGSLKRREALSGRLADVLSQLFLASAVLKRFEDQGRPRDDLPLVHWACRDALYRAQTAFEGLLQNFPVRWLASALRAVVFPGGRYLAPPDDRLGRDVARLLLTPSPSRDRLTAGLFVPSESDDPLARMDDALSKVVAAAPIEERLHVARREGRINSRDLETQIGLALATGLIDTGEAEVLRTTRAAMLEVIKVDDFPPDFARREREQEAP